MTNYALQDIIGSGLFQARFMFLYLIVLPIAALINQLTIEK
jgi:hypothetical protein